MTPERAYYKAERAYYKAYGAGKRLPELEDIIMTCPWFSYLYALGVIKCRWIEAENIIMTDPDNCFLYAKDVIKGKLPEKMHNMMILHAIENSNDFWVKRYFELIK